MIRIPNLDIELLRAFVAVAEYSSFTSAGNAVGATQSAISIRIKKLEDRLGNQLLKRTPQAVSLTKFGQDFILDARCILEAHDNIALRAIGEAERHFFKLGISDHAAGGYLPTVLADLKKRYPNIQFLVTVSGSEKLYTEFGNGQFDAAIVRKEEGDTKGKTLFKDKLKWVASNITWDKKEPLPFITLSSPCIIRSIAKTALQLNGIAWKDTFIGTSVSAIQAAVSAGLGVACLDGRNIPVDCQILTKRDGLPPLPSTEIVMHHGELHPDSSHIAKEIEKAFKRAKAQDCE